MRKSDRISPSAPVPLGFETALINAVFVGFHKTNKLMNGIALFRFGQVASDI
jgi:hypothetical protein